VQPKNEIGRHCPELPTRGMPRRALPRPKPLRTYPE
jgi:hypothetical protein